MPSIWCVWRRDWGSCCWRFQGLRREVDVVVPLCLARFASNFLGAFQCHCGPRMWEIMNLGKLLCPATKPNKSRVIHSFIHSFLFLPFPSFIYLLIHVIHFIPFIHFIHLYVHAFIHSFISFIHFIHFIHSFHLFVRSFFPSFLYSLIHFIHPLHCNAIIYIYIYILQCTACHVMSCHVISFWLHSFMYICESSWRCQQTSSSCRLPFRYTYFPFLKLPPPPPEGTAGIFPLSIPFVPVVPHKAVAEVSE